MRFACIAVHYYTGIVCSIMVAIVFHLHIGSIMYVSHITEDIPGRRVLDAASGVGLLSCNLIVSVLPTADIESGQLICTQKVQEPHQKIGFL